MENFVITIAFLLIGMGIRRLPDFSRETGKILNAFVIYISLPALILLKIPDLVFSTNLLVPAVMPWGMVAFSAILILFLSRLFNWERKTTGCMMLMVPLGNTSFLGIPMVAAFFGQAAIPYALLYDQLGSFLALSTYGAIILAIYGTWDSKPSVTSVIRKIVTFPPFLALILALVLKEFSPPTMAVSLLKTLAATLVPLVMIAVGFQLKLRLNKQLSLLLVIGLAIKLIIAPMAALAFSRATGLNGEAVRVSIFESAMPPMVSAGALALLADLSPTLAAAMVGLGIIVCFATLPLIFQLLP